MALADGGQKQLSQTDTAQIDPLLRLRGNRSILTWVMSSFWKKSAGSKMTGG